MCPTEIIHSLWLAEVGLTEADFSREEGSGANFQDTQLPFTLPPALPVWIMTFFTTKELLQLLYYPPYTWSFIDIKVIFKTIFFIFQMLKMLSRTSDIITKYCANPATSHSSLTIFSTN